MIMTPTITELWKLPEPATALLRDPVFNVLIKRQCEIVLFFEGNGDEERRLSLLLDGVEAYKCTYLTSCTADMFDSAYGKLIRLEETPWLIDLLDTYKKGRQSKSTLQHLMICFDDGPCYEFICVDFSIIENQPNS